MKVCTDACLFGAMIPEISKTHFFNVLDIGTGTGLLALMYAQRTPLAVIDALEIEQEAYIQAKENAGACPWKERINIIQGDILHYLPGKKYELIFSNPPFYEDEMKSGDEGKNKAMHDSSLLLSELVKAVGSNLAADGIFAVLLPFHRIDYFIKEAGLIGLYPTQKVLVRQTPKHDYFRGILFFKRSEIMSNINIPGTQFIPGEQNLTNELTIKDLAGNYSNEFVDLLKDYYLYL